MAVDDEALRAVLGALAPDVETAAAEYIRLHRRLVLLFARRGVAHAEELADETMDRVGRRLRRGLVLTSTRPYGYFAGVAGFVYRESLRASRKVVHGGALEEWLIEERALAAGGSALDRLLPLLARLSEADRDLILDYYSADSSSRASERGRLAAAHGLSPNALRIRVHRILAQLRARMRATNRDVS